MGPEESATSTARDGDPRSRLWAMFLHFSVLVGYIIPIIGFLAPIIIWQVKKWDLPEIDIHGKIVVNWIISYCIYLIGCIILSFFLIGILLVPVLCVLGLVFPIIGGIKANNGEAWRYPLSIRFLK